MVEVLAELRRKELSDAVQLLHVRAQGCPNECTDRLLQFLWETSDSWSTSHSYTDMTQTTRKLYHSRALIELSNSQNLAVTHPDTRESDRESVCERV